MARITQAQARQMDTEKQALDFFRETLSALKDPRRPQGVRYPLHSVVVIALMAMVCGAEDAQAMEYFGESNQDWLSGFLEMPHGAPTQDVFLSVLAALDPKAFGGVFHGWASLLSKRLRDDDNSRLQISIDGKKSRRSYNPADGLSAIHTVSAWMSEAGLVIAQTKTNEKSNEITAIPELLKMFDISRTTITMDAMGCQTKIAASIVEKGGDYLLAVKKNQPMLHHNIETAFNFVENSKITPLNELLPPSIEIWTEADKGHGRVEQRTIEISRDISWITEPDKWQGLNFFAKLTRERTIIKTGKVSTEIAYYIGSNSHANAQQTATEIRRHWSIENGLHWVLDMAFREDEARHRIGNIAQNMTILRHFALNVIKQDKTRKIGVANSRKRAGWDRRYLIKLLIESGSN